MNRENKNSFLLNSALFFSTMGSTATTLGFITYIFNTTHSPFNTGAVTIATLLVGMLLGPFLGILVKEKGLMWSMVVWTAPQKLDTIFGGAVFYVKIFKRSKRKGYLSF